MLSRMFLMLLTLLSASASASASAAAAAPLYSTMPCDVASVTAELAARLQCGVLQVQNGRGGRFQLAVTRLAAAQPQAGAAPVVLLQSGPALVPQTLAEPADFAQGHELILLDLRGTGRSSPQFCPELAPALAANLQQNTDDSSLLSGRSQALLQCQQQMQQQGYSAADFGAVQTVQDLELLRTELNIEKWHLYARGNGTVAALHYLAVAAPALQSVTLDSVYPPDELLTSFKLQQDQWLRQLDQLCQQQAGCPQRFGAMPDLFNRALARVGQTPLQIGQPPAQLRLTAETLRLAVMAAATSPQTLSLLPLWLDEVAQGQSVLSAPWAELLVSAGGQTSAAMMAAECADRRRFYQTGRADSLEQLFGLPDGVCPAFGLTPEQLQVPQVPATAQVRTPVLLLAGGLDLFQPDSLVLSQWLGPHSQLVSVPAALHGVRTAEPCLRKMVSDFIRAPQRFGPPACLTQLAKPILLTDIEPIPQLASAFAELRRSEPGQAWLILGLGLGLAALCGVCWPLLALSGRWLSGAPVRLQRSALCSGLLISLTLACWAGLGMTLWQGISRHSAELWLGLPPDSQPWRQGIALLALPALGCIWWLARQQQWRQLVAQAGLLTAMWSALALQLLP